MIPAPVLAIGRAVPLWAWFLLAALLYGGYQHNRAKSAGETLRKAEAAAAADEIATWRDRAEKAERVAKSQEEAASAARSESTANARAAADARTAAARVRNQAAALAASAAAAGTGPARDCAPAIAAGNLHAELLGRAVERAEELAKFADESSTAGRACQRSYDALR